MALNKNGAIYNCIIMVFIRDFVGYYGDKELNFSAFENFIVPFKCAKFNTFVFANTLKFFQLMVILNPHDGIKVVFIRFRRILER